MELSRSWHCSVTPLSPKNPTEGFWGASGAQEGRSKKRSDVRITKSITCSFLDAHYSATWRNKTKVFEETCGVTPRSKTLVPRKPIMHAKRGSLGQFVHGHGRT